MGREIMFRAAPPADDRIPYGSAHASRFFDLRFPAGEPAGVALVIHGGFWRAGFDLVHAGNLCVALTAAGLITANIEYRRVGEEGGGWPGTFEDVRAAVSALRDRFGSARQVLIGHSAGGHLALLAAAEFDDLAGVVALGPVADLRSAWDLHVGEDAAAEFLGGTPDTTGARYDAASPSAHRASIPRILIHGLEDRVVPVSLSRTFAKARGNDPGPVEVLEVPEADHFDLIDPQSSAWPVVLDAVNRLLARKKEDAGTLSPRPTC